MFIFRHKVATTWHNRAFNLKHPVLPTHNVTDDILLLVVGVADPALAAVHPLPPTQKILHHNIKRQKDKYRR